jgi:hypothetical protein
VTGFVTVFENNTFWLNYAQQECNDAQIALEQRFA